MKLPLCHVCDRPVDPRTGWLVYVIAITTTDGCFPVLSVARPALPLMEADANAVRAACGNNCMQKLVERWATGTSLDPAHKVRRSA